MKLRLPLYAFVIISLVSLGCQKTPDNNDSSTDSGFIGKWKGQVTRLDPTNATSSTDVLLTFSSPDLLVYEENNMSQNYSWKSDDNERVLTLLLRQTIGTGQVMPPLVDYPKNTYQFSDENNHLEFWYKNQSIDIKYILDRQ